MGVERLTGGGVVGGGEHAAMLSGAPVAATT
jgi:hypothetical protein